MNLSSSRKLRLLVLALLIFSFSLNVLAEDNSTTAVPEDTQNETGAMSTSKGADMRLLQLERHVKVHNALAQKIIDAVKAKGNDTAPLEAALQESITLLDEIASAPREPAQEAVKAFVDLKHDTNELIKEFRTTAKLYLNSTEQAQFKAELSTLRKELHNDLKQKILQQRREHNAEKLERHLTTLNSTMADAITKLKNGTLTPNDAKELIKKEYKNKSAEKRNETLQALKILREKNVNDEKEHVLQAIAKIDERRKQRTEAREQKIIATAPLKIAKRVTDNVQQRIAKKIVPAQENTTTNTSTKRIGGTR